MWHSRQTLNELTDRQNKNNLWRKKIKLPVASGDGFYWEWTNITFYDCNALYFTRCLHYMVYDSVKIQQTFKNECISSYEEKYIDKS